MAIESQTVFVTGGTGKIGRLLVWRLASLGFFVKVLTRKGDNLWLETDRISIVKGSLGDRPVVKEAMSGCEYVFHLAAYQDITDKRIEKFREINVRCTRALLEIAKGLGIKKIVYVSTAAVFEPTGKIERDERWPQRPCCSCDYYLQTKIEALELVRDAKVSLPIVIAYPTAVIDLKDFFSSAPVKSPGFQKFLWEKIGGGTPGALMNLIGPAGRVSNYVITEDLVDGLMSAAFYGKTGEEYILGGENISAGDYLKIIAKKLNKRVFPFRIPVALFKIIYIFRAIIPLPPVVRLIAKGSIRDVRLSSDKAKKELNYNPQIKLACC